jgi:hydrogenase maturation protein HypF
LTVKLSKTIESTDITCLQIKVFGTIQGVGFRPFIWRLARKLHLTGRVCNSNDCAEILIQGPNERLSTFIETLKHYPPPVSRIDTIEIEHHSPVDLTSFDIATSRTRTESAFSIPPDLAVCPECLEEIKDKEDRRYLYPFTNCTQCGPRYSVINSFPYDRDLTTMSSFKMCESCDREYNDPGDRRFHAQPVACPDCGPSLFVLDRSGEEINLREPIINSLEAIQEGKIVAIKGVGGVHLAVDPRNNEAVATLRKRKQRPFKPLAVLVKDIQAAEKYARISENEKELLLSPARPIVLLRKRDESALSPLISPGLGHIGLMLPYSPLHHLLFPPGQDSAGATAIVLTSANRGGEPTIHSNETATGELEGIADLYLLHNRDIANRCDDSVVMISGGQQVTVRRARGYSMDPIKLNIDYHPVLAFGSDLKNTTCLIKGSTAHMTPYLGDLDKTATRKALTHEVESLLSLLDTSPDVIAVDKHPAYHTSKMGEKWGNLPLIRVQHHHAHIAATMAEHGVRGPVIGVSLDGTGYGDDGAVWGGEILVSDLVSYRRAAHLEYVPMPGGDSAAREPWRMALSYIHSSGMSNEISQDNPLFEKLSRLQLKGINQMIVKGFNTPKTSSMGRLFDAVSSLLGICLVNQSEGQAAMLLEAKSLDTINDFYTSRISGDEPMLLSVKEMIREILNDQKRGVPAEVIGGKFHSTITDLLARVCWEISKTEGLNEVVFGGGVFLNRLLLNGLRKKLESIGLRVRIPRIVPINDSGISLGQGIVAGAIFESARNWKGK